MKLQKSIYWVVADTHFGHGLMLKPEIGRPKDYADRIIRNLQRAVKPGDVLIHLGDVCFKNDDAWHARFCSEVPGIKWLILGNHDSKSANWYITHRWSFVSSLFLWRAFGHVLCFSHCPVPLDEVFYTLNIHGHSHGDGHRAKDAGVLRAKNPNQILIAMENTDYQPVKLDSLLQGRQPAFAHHYYKYWLDGENKMKKMFDRPSTAMSKWKERATKHSP